MFAPFVVWWLSLYSPVMAKFCIPFGIAGAIAVALAIVMHDVLDVSPVHIRDAALLCSALLGVGLLSNRIGDRK
jgi:hypothetical protein